MFLLCLFATLDRSQSNQAYSLALVTSAFTRKQSVFRALNVTGLKQVLLFSRQKKNKIKTCVILSKWPSVNDVTFSKIYMIRPSVEPRRVVDRQTREKWPRLPQVQQFEFRMGHWERLLWVFSPQNATKSGCGANEVPQLSKTSADLGATISAVIDSATVWLIEVAWRRALSKLSASS